MISEVAKSSLVSVYLDPVTVRVVKSAIVGTVIAATPLTLIVAVVLLLGFAMAIVIAPSAPLIVAVSHSCVCSELCKNAPDGTVSPKVDVAPKVAIFFRVAGHSPG